MDFIFNYIDFVLHIDRHLDVLVQTYGTSVYLIPFAIIFSRDGPRRDAFLPVDSLLFVRRAPSPPAVPSISRPP